jgi:hypothetical protein
VTNVSVIPVTLKVPPLVFVNVIMSVESLYVPPLTNVSLTSIVDKFKK